MKTFLRFLTLMLTTCLAYAGSPKISKDLEGRNAGDTVDVIVQFQPGKASHSAIQAGGGKVKANLDIVNGVLASLPARALEALANNPNVTYISPDRSVKGLLDYANATVGASIAASYGWDGTGIGVAVIDSGVTAVNDLKNGSSSRVVYSQNFASGSNAAYGHGTHVAGILGGNGSMSTGFGYTKSFRGIAPKVSIISLRVLDGEGTGTDSSVIAGIQRAIELKSTYNIRIINLSLGRPVYDSYTVDPLCLAVESAWNAGIVVVVSAGNEGRNNSQGTHGYATIKSPGNDPYVITVGAMKTMGTPFRTDDLIASYSSKGPTAIDHIVKPDLVAPGNGIISLLSSTNAIPLAYYKLGYTGNSSNYFKLSGTSMAAPMVSGAAALLLQKTPWLTPDQVKARLMKTASKAFPTTSIAIDPATGQLYTSQYDIFTVGAGYLDIAAALANNDTATVKAISPKAVYDPATRHAHLVQGNGLIWGDTLVWGNSLVWGEGLIWGDSLIWGDGLIWGDSMVWGDSTTQGFSLIWGDGLIWGDSRTVTDESTSIAIQGEN